MVSSGIIANSTTSGRMPSGKTLHVGDDQSGQAVEKEPKAAAQSILDVRRAARSTR
jgi:hypothetical protein